ncbi:DUF4279 domain-containing protein [Myxosarcina sp. GI1]|uniref:DUF4279 domain-containing protein n=1 Tax=Myxosarcina sp. GI1 TaxID=1541065 RepID=UPI00068D633A|nr:DUF4279 domain-containing protein [Myxosarcina sp. GI1]
MNDIISVGGEVEQIKVSLRFTGDDLDPDFISNLLDCQPTISYRKGDVLFGKSFSRVADLGLWSLSDVEKDTNTLEIKIRRLLNRVSADSAAWNWLSHFQGNIFCGVFIEDWNRGFSLSSELMQYLVERKLTIDFDIYCNAIFLEDDDE